LTILFDNRVKQLVRIARRGRQTRLTRLTINAVFVRRLCVLFGLEQHGVHNYLLEYFRIGKFHFGLLLLCGVHNARATHFAQFLAIAMEIPTTNLLVGRRVFDEHDAILELDGHAFEQLDVFEQIVVRRVRVRVLVVVSIDEQADARLVGRVEYLAQLALRRDHGHNGRAVERLHVGRIVDEYLLFDQSDQRLNAIELGFFEQLVQLELVHCVQTKRRVLVAQIVQNELEMFATAIDEHIAVRIDGDIQTTREHGSQHVVLFGQRVNACRKESTADVQFDIALI